MAPSATTAEAAKRPARLQEVEAAVEPLPFDAGAARSYGLIVSAVVGESQNSRGGQVAIGQAGQIALLLSQPRSSPRTPVTALGLARQ